MAFIVDGMNVIGTRPDGWWRDRGAARERLVAEVARLGDIEGRATVVFDGRAAAGEVERAAQAGVSIVFAPGGPNAADDAIVEIVSVLDRPGDTTVVTSDRGLVERLGRFGVKIERAKTFRSRLDSSP
ncbi:MAG TPA: NYN domain-containing protein [Acidimicrobiales bacterium]